MAKTYNAFLKHISGLSRENNFTGRFSQKDINFLYQTYLSSGLETFKAVVKKRIKTLKAER